MSAPRTTWASRCYWLIAGLLWGFTLAGMLTIGVYLLPLAALCTLIGVLVPRFRGPAAFWMLSGVGVVPLHIAWLNRFGPGEHCETTPMTVSCTEMWSPWPFVAVGLLMVVAGIGLDLGTRPRSR